MKISNLCKDVIKLIVNKGDVLRSKYFVDLDQYVCELNQQVNNYQDEANHKQKDLALLPNILFFDPFEQLKDSEFFYCPHCKEDTGKNVPLDPSLGTEWEYGESSGKEPRLIWDIFWYCALVGKITKCCNGHSITSYHPGILQQISNYPFLLSHKRGMTKSTFDLIIRLVEQGNNFSSIESIFLSSFVDIVHRKLALINNTNMQTSIEFIEQLKLFTPSHDFITSCFVFNFDNYKDVYLSEMDKLTFIWLSGDHTFRVAANIGK